MNYKYLTILEISGKQKYIFASNKLRDNVLRSEEIAYMTSAEGIRDLTSGTKCFCEKDNYVYAGGGHTVLEFNADSQEAARQKAVAFGKVYSRKVHEIFPKAELFIKSTFYDPAHSPGWNLENLTKALEEKKSIRKASFHQGSFGIEKIDSTTLKPNQVPTAAQDAYRRKLAQQEREGSLRLMPEGSSRLPSYQFEDLGGTKGDTNYIAVVHIDGNGMGSRVSTFYETNKNLPWNVFKAQLSAFSDAIDADFKAAYRKMNFLVDIAISQGLLKDLHLSEENFPVRRIITSGDDICFVSDGRIGIACAAAFIKALHTRVNEVDGKEYSACAGVAIVHAKYPFFRAYDLAESLCSHAKRYGANIHPEDNGQSVSSIDWHLEQGEIGDSLTQIRQQYEAADHTRLELRPYIIAAPAEAIQRDPARRFTSFARTLSILQGKMDEQGRSHLKMLRSQLLQGRTATRYYLKFHKLEDVVRQCYIGSYARQEQAEVGKGNVQPAYGYVETYENGRIQPQMRSILFDAIEIMDTYLSLGEEAENAD